MCGSTQIAPPNFFRVFNGPEEGSKIKCVEPLIGWNLKSSHSEEELKMNLKGSAKLIDIKLLDHPILSPQNGKYYSFRDDGLI